MNTETNSSQLVIEHDEKRAWNAYREHRKPYERLQKIIWGSATVLTLGTFALSLIKGTENSGYLLLNGAIPLYIVAALKLNTMIEAKLDNIWHKDWLDPYRTIGVPGEDGISRTEADRARRAKSVGQLRINNHKS